MTTHDAPNANGDASGTGLRRYFVWPEALRSDKYAERKIAVYVGEEADALLAAERKRHEEEVAAKDAEVEAAEDRAERAERNFQIASELANEASVQLSDESEELAALQPLAEIGRLAVEATESTDADRASGISGDSVETLRLRQATFTKARDYRAAHPANEGE